MKKRVLAMLLALAMALSLASCGSSPAASGSGDEPDTASGDTAAVDTETADAAVPSTETSDGKTVVHVGLNGSVTEVAPYASTNEIVEPIRNTIYQQLFTTASVSSQELIPCIGKSWEWLDDYTIAIEIYDYVHDVDGNPITASDVVFSYETCKAANVQTDTAYIDSIAATGDYTLEMTLTVPNDQTTMVKLLSHIAIVNQAAYEADPDTTPGTTAYKLTSYINGSEYVCEKIDDYWQTDASLNPFDQQANVDKLVFEIIPEATQMTNALEAGEIQMAVGADGREAARFEEGGENEEGFSVDTYTGSFSLLLLFNCTEESPTSDINLRKAILYAIDADGVVKTVLNGAGVAASDLASDQLNGFLDEWLDEEYYGYDADKAAEYLAQSSYNGETLKLEASSNYSSELELIQAQLGAIGIKSEIQTFENALWQEEKVAGTGESSWTICLDGLGGSVVTTAWRVKFNPDNFSTGLPQTGYLDETFDDLLNTAATTQDPADIDAAHDYLVEQAYAFGLYVPAAKCVTVDSISDIVYSHKGYVVPASCNYDNYTITE